MVLDKSLYYYGGPYHVLIDTITGEQRKQVLQFVPQGTSVLDAGCGTGELSLELKRKLNCQVVGVDLSVQMITFAQKRNPYSDVKFLHRDASHIPDFEDNAFDLAVMCQVMHEVPLNVQISITKELLRLANQVILSDYNSPMPKNSQSFVSRLIEATLGRDHHHNFHDYLNGGGLVAMIDMAGFSPRIQHRLEFNHACHQVIILG